MSIIIRPCNREDEADIVNICYRTGFMGEDLTGTHRFNDVRLFGYLFCLYYLWHEQQHCFVAEDETTARAVGYILGTTDTSKQRIAFGLKMGAVIAGRLLFYTTWRHPESLLAMLHLVRHADLRTGIEHFDREFPAHLHVDILPEYQKLGLGTRLLHAFENEMIKRSVTGIHLRTSNLNHKAFPFYLKNGYEVVSRSTGSVWANVPQYQSVIFAKRLQQRAKQATKEPSP